MSAGCISASVRDLTTGERRICDQIVMNRPYMLGLSEKRDAVSTVQLPTTGSIARLAVIAEYRNRGMKENGCMSSFVHATPGD